MANPSFLNTFTHHRDPRLLWPVAAIASVLAHGLALGLIRTLSVQTPALVEGEMAPLPIQLVALPPDQAPAGEPTDATGAELPMAAADPAAEAPTPAAPQNPTTTDFTDPQVDPLPPRPSGQPAGEVATMPPVDRPPVVPAPRPTPAPVTPASSVVTPAPPRPATPVSPAPAVNRSPGVEPPPTVNNPRVDPPPAATPEPPPSAEAPPPGGGAGQGGQVVPVGLRLDPSGRDIPDTAPQLLGASAIDLQPLASGCGFANLEALLAGTVATSVQMQIRVEPSGDISSARLLQSTGSSGVDDLVSCVVRQQLRLQPASSAGVPQLTDAYILDARIQFF